MSFDYRKYCHDTLKQHAEGTNAHSFYALGNYLFIIFTRELFLIIEGVKI